jgi:hypothetical protein
MKWDNPMISEIIKLEDEITRAVINGHKPHEEDQFKHSRDLLQKMRLWAKIPTHAQMHQERILIKENRID